jgi:membrane-bound serine protease (ClpP class)
MSEARVVRRLAIALVTVGALAGLVGLGARQAAAAPTTAPVDVVEVNGLFDQVEADAVDHAIDRAARDGSQAVVLQMNTGGSVVSRQRMTEVATHIAHSPVLVAIWVGPSGAQAYGAAGQLLGAAAVTGMAPGSHIGNFGAPLVVDGKPLAIGPPDLQDRVVGAVEARTLGVLKLGKDDNGTPVLGDMIVVLNGVTYQGRTLETATVVQKNGSDRRQPTGTPRFFKLGLVPRLLHTAASPPVTYLLLTIGLALLVFEFFTAGVGVAGLVGAICLVLGCYGVGALPVRDWAVALLVLSMLAFAVDVQTGVPRFWTGVGTVFFVLASVFLVRGHVLPWLTLVVGIGGVLLAFVSGMPSMVRSRFATPTIGREWMLGETGTAASAVSPEGVVLVGSGRWRARTNRATPIAAGDRVRVVAIDGVTLEVEPESGGARDYRERAARHS